MRPIISLVCASLFAILAQPALAERLKVVTSIRPVESLVEYISQGLADVTVLVPANTSPHTYALKPSDAQNLQNADVIFWVDENFESFLKKAIQTLPQNATAIEFTQQPGIALLEVREFAPTQGLTEPLAETEPEHGAHDLHIWLDPENAKTMANIIADTLSAADTVNEIEYRKNARELIGRLDAQMATTKQRLAAVKDKQFVTFHDAYQYYEKRFELKNTGTVTLNPEIKPGAKRLTELKNALANNQIACIFSEPQFDAKLIELAIEGTNVNSAEIDPLGADLVSGPSLYFNLIENMTSSIVSCLSQPQ